MVVAFESTIQLQTARMLQPLENIWVIVVQHGNRIVIATATVTIIASASEIMVVVTVTEIGTVIITAVTAEIGARGVARPLHEVVVTHLITGVVGATQGAPHVAAALPGVVNMMRQFLRRQLPRRLPQRILGGKNRTAVCYIYYSVVCGWSVKMSKRSGQGQYGEDEGLYFFLASVKFPSSILPILQDPQ